jgi:hypothetical protein
MFVTQMSMDSLLKLIHNLMLAKKGVSETVSAILIVLITIGAALLLSQMVITFVKDRASSGTECLAYNQGYFKFVPEIEHIKSGILHSNNFNCNDDANVAGTNYFLAGVSLTAQSIDKSAADKVKGMAIVFTGKDGETTSCEINKGDTLTTLSSNCWIHHKTGPHSAKIPRNGEVVTYVTERTIGGNDKYYSAEVFPILESGTICKVGDKIELASECSSTIDLGA